MQFVGSVKARKHPEEYMQQVGEQALAAEPIKVEGRHVDIILPKQDKFMFNTKLERDNSIWAYSSDDDANQREEKPLVKELETDASSFWVYSDDDHVKRPNQNI